MKSIFLSFVCLLCFIAVDAQQEKSSWSRNNLNLRLGPEVGWPVGDFNNTQGFGIGGSALLDVPVLTRFSLIFYAGYVNFAGDKISNGSGSKYKRSTVVPIRTGINYKLSKNIYATAQLGESTVRLLENSKTGFSQALGLGYFNQNFDLGFRWDHHYVHGGLSSLNLKFAYVIEFGLKK